MKRVFSFFVLVALLIAFSPTALASVISFHSFTFDRPNSERLITEVLDTNQAIFGISAKGGRTQFTFQENFVSGPLAQIATAREIADDYRKQEHQNMIELGVKSGMYEIEALNTGQEQVGDKLFYTMSYTTKAHGMVQYAQLYLYFPEEQNVSEFLVAHYSEFAASEDLLLHSYKKAFLNILESVTYTGSDHRMVQAAPPTLLDVFRQAEEAVRLIRQEATGPRKHACGVKLEGRDRFDQGEYLNFFADPRQKSKIDIITHSDFNASSFFNRAKALASGPAYGWIYDRNQDGLVDYLMYNIGPGLAAPENFEGSREEFQFDMVEDWDNMMTSRFWHVADENFDGINDAVLSRLFGQGWFDGWILAQDTDFDGTYESCVWYPRKLGHDPQECLKDEYGFSAPGREKGFPIHIPATGHALDVVISAASRCKLVTKGKADFYATPEQYLGRRIRIDVS
jgi:hypothetical protein